MEITSYCLKEFIFVSKHLLSVLTETTIRYSLQTFVSTKLSEETRYKVSGGELSYTVIFDLHSQHSELNTALVSWQRTYQESVDQFNKLPHLHDLLSTHLSYRVSFLPMYLESVWSNLIRLFFSVFPIYSMPFQLFLHLLSALQFIALLNKLVERKEWIASLLLCLPRVLNHAISPDTLWHHSFIILWRAKWFITLLWTILWFLRL